MDNYRKEIRQLMIAVNKVEGLFYFAAKKLGVKENTLTLLYALDDGKKHSQKQICEEWFIPRTTINTVVKECKHAGYITLIHEKNSKEKVIIITENGKKYAQTILQKIYFAEQAAFTKTLAECRTDFVKGMSKFTEYLENEFEQHIIEAPDDPPKNK